MPTPLEKLTSDWQTHYSDMPLSDFVTKVHAKMYSDMPFADFTDKLGLTVPNEDIKTPTPEPSPMSAVEGAYPDNVSGQVDRTNQGGFLETAGRSIGAAAGNIVPSAIKTATGVVSLLTPSGMEGISKVARGGLGISPEETPSWEAFKQGLVDRYGSPLNTLATDPVGLGLEAYGVGTALKAGSRAISAARAIPLEKELATTIRSGIDKGIRPTVAGKGNYAQTEKYYSKAQEAVEAITSNKRNLQLTDAAGNATEGLPKNLNQFSQAIDQTKRQVFNEYNDIVQKAGAKNIVIDQTPIIKELQAFVNDPVNQSYGAGTSYAAKRIEKIQGLNLTPVQTQDAIALINNRLSAYYKNPSPGTATVAAVDALEVNMLRKSLDSAVEASPYQALKNRYGALREIEKEVSNRALVDARKNTKGLIDFTDIYSAGKLTQAVMTLNAPGAVSAAAMKGIAAWYKYTNNPNYVIQKMFTKADELMGKRPPPVLPAPAAKEGSTYSGGPAIEPGSPAYGLGEQGANLSQTPDIARGGVPPVGRYDYPLGNQGGMLIPPEFAGILPRNASPPATWMPGSRNILWQAYGQGGANPAYSMSDAEFLRSLGKKYKSKK